jgi:hypothetical protein
VVMLRCLALVAGAAMTAGAAVGAGAATMAAWAIDGGVGV